MPLSNVIVTEERYVGCACGSRYVNTVHRTDLNEHLITWARRPNADYGNTADRGTSRGWRTDRGIFRRRAAGSVLRPRTRVRRGAGKRRVVRYELARCARAHGARPREISARNFIE